MVLPILIRWVLGRGGRSISDEELKRLEEEAKRGKLGMVFWNKESAEEWYEEMLKMLGEKDKYTRVLAGNMSRTYYMLPHIPHAWKILERVGALKDVMGGLIINDEVMDHFIDLEPAHISWAYMMGARTPEEIKILGEAIKFVKGFAEAPDDKHYPRTDTEYLKEIAKWIEKYKDVEGFDVFIRPGYELLQKFRQEGRAFGKTVFDEEDESLEDAGGEAGAIVALKDSLVIMHGGKADVLSYGDNDIIIRVRRIERVEENGEFRGIKIEGVVKRMNSGG